MTALERLRAHADAAVVLSEAKRDFTEVELDRYWFSDEEYAEALARLASAEEVYDAAYAAYTNPFGVDKTVDARWPEKS